MTRDMASYVEAPSGESVLDRDALVTARRPPSRAHCCAVTDATRLWKASTVSIASDTLKLMQPQHAVHVETDFRGTGG